MVGITKKVTKASESIIRKVEKELAQNNEVYIDKSVNKEIDREISNLGKEKLIADHINNLARNYDEHARDKLLFLLVKLYSLNMQVHESLIRELKSNKKLLIKRITDKITKGKVHKDLYKKLLAIANKHYEFVKNYAKHFNPKKKYAPSLVSSVVDHKRKAEAIYNALTNIKVRKTLHGVLLHKLDDVFQSLINSTADLSNKIAEVAKQVSNDNLRDLKNSAEEIDSIISSKVDVLREFAYKYSYNVIHSDHFFDFDGNRIILITENDHRHLAV